MVSKCSVGEILRKAYTRKDGTRVKSTCIKDVGKKGKSSKVLPTPVKGSLGQYGYKNVKNTPVKTRHDALEKGVKDVGYATIIRRVNLIANYNKNTNPAVYDILRKDIGWMQKKLGPEYAKSYKKESKGAKKGSGSKKSKPKKASKGSKKSNPKKASKTSKMVKSGTMIVNNKTVQLWRMSGSEKKFYRRKNKNGVLVKRYVYN